MIFLGQQKLGDSAVYDEIKRGAKAGIPSFQKLLKDSRRKPPQRLAYLLAFYQDLRGQQVRGMYVEPLSYSELKAYADLHRVALEPWEVDVLVRLDRVWLRCVPKPDEK